MAQKLHAVLFDLDGTLADTLADLANATNWALASLGCPTHPRTTTGIWSATGHETSARERCRPSGNRLSRTPCASCDNIMTRIASTRRGSTKASLNWLPPSPQRGAEWLFSPTNLTSSPGE